MANVDILGKFILSFEGGFVNDPDDAGGATNKGVTIATWKKQGYDKNGDGVIDVQDLKLISDADAIKILKENYWNRWKADEIKDQSIANLLVDSVWGSGKYGITIYQQVLGVVQDGIVGPKTLSAINNYPNQKELFNKFHDRREVYLRTIAKNGNNWKFLKGWLRRLNCIRYGSLTLNDVHNTKITF